MTELFETRRIIEVGLAEQAAVKATDEDFAHMDASLAKARANLDEPMKYLYAEMEFHESVFNASRNKILSAVMASLNDLLVESRENSIKTFQDLRESLDEHIKIFKALKTRDPRAAGRAMMEHLDDVRRRLEAMGNSPMSKRRTKRAVKTASK